MSGEEAGDANVRVAVRCRPLSGKETRSNEQSIFHISDDHILITSGKERGGKEDARFAFDYMYGPDSSQEQVYLDLGQPLLEKAFGGFNATIFAYGQTGSGKTHCMSGSPGQEGIIPRMNRALFERVTATVAENPGKKFLVECSYFEVYNEIVYDLLDPSRTPGKSNKGLDIKEDKVRGIFVKGLQTIVVESAEKMHELMVQGNSVRVQAATLMNNRSSRSHSVFTIRVQQRDDEDKSHNVFAKINLVDLAGSERASKTGASGATLREGSNINKSLSTLGMVINKLAETGKHPNRKVFIPYRNSKLTRVLQQSLGGNSLTCMLATLSPARSNRDETLTTLRYANNAKSIPVKAKKNEAGAEVERLNKEVAALRKRLMEKASGALSEQEQNQLEAKYKGEIEELESVMKQTWEDKAKLSQQYEEERIRLQRQSEEEKVALQAQYRAERQRRRQILSQKGDVAMTIRELFSVKEPAGVRSRYLQQDSDAWIKMVTDMLDLVHGSKEQTTIAAVYKEAVDADIGRLKSYTASRAAAMPSQEELVTAVATLNQAQAKLKALRVEGRSMLDSQRKATALGDQLHASLVVAFNAKPPPTATVGDDVAGGAGAGAGAGAAEGESESEQATPAGCDAQAVADYGDALELVATQVQAVLAKTKSDFAAQRSQVFGLAETCNELVAALQAELALPSPTKGMSAEARELQSELQEQQHRHRERLAAAASKFQDITLATPRGEPPSTASAEGDDVAVMLNNVWEATDALKVCISERLDVVRASASRMRVKEAALIQELQASVATLQQKNGELESSLASTEEQLREAREARARVQAERETVTAYLSTASKKIEALEREVGEERSKRQREVEAAQVKIDELQRTAAEAVRSSEDTRAQLDRALAREAEAQAAKQQLADNLQATASAADAGNAAMEALTRDLTASRTRITELAAEIEEARKQSTAADQRASEAQVAAEALQRQLAAEKANVEGLAGKLTAASEEVASLQQQLTEAETAKAAAVAAQESGSSTAEALHKKVEHLTQKAEKAKTKAREAGLERDEAQQLLADQKAEFAAVQAEAVQLRGEMLKLQASRGRDTSQQKALEDQVTEMTGKLAEQEAALQAMQVQLAEAQEKAENSLAQLEVVTDERDVAREKEEEYYLELESKLEELSAIQSGYVELSDRLNDKLDQVFDLQADLENAQATTLRWQKLALTGNDAESAAAPAGSAGNAIKTRKQEHLLRATIIRIYNFIVGSYNEAKQEEEEGVATVDGADKELQPSGDDSDDSALAAAKAVAPSVSAAPVSRPRAAKPVQRQIVAAGADEDEDEDEYSGDFDDYDDDEFDPPPTTAAVTDTPKVTPLALSLGSAAAARALTTPRLPLQPNEVENLPLEELCERLEACVRDIDTSRVELIRKLQAALKSGQLL